MTTNAFSSPSTASGRGPLLLLGCICLALVGGALFFQYARDEDPCPLCILQRYGFIFTAVFAFIAALFPKHGTGRSVFIVLGLLSAIGGGATAARHVWIQQSLQSCGFDTLQPIVDALPPATWLPGVFKTAGLCETLYPPIFGMSLPAWALIGFIAAVLALVSALIGARRVARARARYH